MEWSKLRNFLGVTAGSLCVLLGILGLFLPVLPTTPFLLLAGWLFATSSKKCYDWLLNHRQLGPYIRDYRKRRGLSVRKKIWVLSTLWLTIGFSAVLVMTKWWSKVALFTIAIGVSVHILRMKTRIEGKADTDGTD